MQNLGLNFCMSYSALVTGLFLVRIGTAKIFCGFVALESVGWSGGAFMGGCRSREIGALTLNPAL